MKPATSKRRLMALVKLLRKLPRRRFNYGRWVGPFWKGKADLSCGTSACALGWATTMRALRQDGLCLTPDKLRGFGGVVRLRRSAGYHAGAKAFGISSREARWLFIPGDCLNGQFGPWTGATPKQVATHIENFVKAKFGSVR